MKFAFGATAFAASMLFIVASAAGAQDAVSLFDPVTGYRVTHYRGVVDRAAEGFTRIDIDRVVALQRRAVFIDVTPAEGGVRADDGTWRLAMPHATIPGAHWFPEAGRGELAPGIGAWFDQGVKQLARGRHDRPIVIFCLADCWMSWNAGLRLRRAGYGRVLWFAEGIDGWKESGRALADVKPARIQAR
ncbi:PQQ-dependent catabolism-associated CXXCW motif protein [soil metagenome]